MGKGDKKTRRGKVTNGSYGKTRLKRKKSTVAIPVKVMDAMDGTSTKSKVEKKVAKPKVKTENANISVEKETKPKATRKKKTED